MKEWVPLVQNKNPDTGLSTYETFVSEKNSQSIIASVFVSIGVMIFASIVAILFYWSYQKDVSLFIALISGLVFIYSIQMVIIVAVLRSKMKPGIFKFYMGTIIFMAFLSLFMIIIFSIKANKSSSPNLGSYVPREVTTYNSTPLA